MEPFSLANGLTPANAAQLGNLPQGRAPG
ncbi:MAG: hypothetical protein QOJ26_39, partial [Thermoplasmata archaeon]|nr:hypothetical protein [Thermoplasmata archaeon]